MEDIIQAKQKLIHDQNSRKLSENIVVKYNGYFYKSPNFSGKFLFYKGVCPYTFVTQSYKRLQQYFGENFCIVPSDIIADNELSYIIKQKEITGRMLHRNDLQQPHIREKFIKLLEINKKMWKQEGFFLDILGTDVFREPFTIHNIFICADNKLYIFDFGLLNKKAHSWTFRVVSYLFYYGQRFWIHTVLLNRFGKK